MCVVCVFSRPQELEIARVMQHLRSIDDTLQKFVALSWLKESDWELFFAVAAAHTAEIMPLVYTPVVSLAVPSLTLISLSVMFSLM